MSQNMPKDAIFYNIFSQYVPPPYCDSEAKMTILRLSTHQKVLFLSIFVEYTDLAAETIY